MDKQQDNLSEEERHQAEEQQNAEAMEEAQIHPPPEASGEDF